MMAVTFCQAALICKSVAQVTTVERLAAPLFGKVVVSNSTWCWNQFCLCLLFLALYMVQAYRQNHYASSHPLYKVG